MWGDHWAVFVHLGFWLCPCFNSACRSVKQWSLGFAARLTKLFLTLQLSLHVRCFTSSLECSSNTKMFFKKSGKVVLKQKKSLSHFECSRTRLVFFLQSSHSVRLSTEIEIINCSWLSHFWVSSLTTVAGLCNTCPFYAYSFHYERHGGGLLVKQSWLKYKALSLVWFPSTSTIFSMHKKEAMK